MSLHHILCDFLLLNSRSLQDLCLTIDVSDKGPTKSVTIQIGESYACHESEFTPRLPGNNDDVDNVLRVCKLTAYESDHMDACSLELSVTMRFCSD